MTGDAAAAAAAAAAADAAVGPEALTPVHVAVPPVPVLFLLLLR